MPMQFKKAEKTKSKLRLALIGPSGSGKTYTALTLAGGLAEGKPVAVIDTERGSASLYADLFAFDVLELETFDPRTYVEAIQAAESAGYGVVVIDSLTHAWSGKGGALELVDRAAKRQQSNNSFGAWREVTPLHNQLVDTLLGAQAHIIATIRTKTDYVQEKDNNNRTVIRKVGLAPVQRDGLEYEFTLVGDMDTDHNLVISKTRIPALADQVINKPSIEVATQLLGWLNSGAEPTAAAAAPTADGTLPTPIRQQPKPDPRPMTQASVIESMSPKRNGGDSAQKAFWGTAQNLGYVDAAGRVDKMAVHRALGLPERDHALTEHMESERLSWNDIARQLHQAGRYKPAAVEVDRVLADEYGDVDGPPEDDGEQGALLAVEPERTAMHNARGAH